MHYLATPDEAVINFQGWPSPYGPVWLRLFYLQNFFSIISYYITNYQLHPCTLACEKLGPTGGGHNFGGNRALAPPKTTLPVSVRASVRATSTTRHWAGSRDDTLSVQPMSRDDDDWQQESTDTQHDNTHGGGGGGGAQSRHIHEISGQIHVVKASNGRRKPRCNYCTERNRCDAFTATCPRHHPNSGCILHTDNRCRSISRLSPIPYTEPSCNSPGNRR